MMLPICTIKFEVGERAPKKNAIAKNTGLRRRQQMMAAAAPPRHNRSERMAFTSSQLDAQPKSGFSLKGYSNESRAGHASNARYRPITLTAVMRAVQKSAPISGLSPKGNAVVGTPPSTEARTYRKTIQGITTAK